jgi:hypothetical protein
LNVTAENLFALVLVLSALSAGSRTICPITPSPRAIDEGNAGKAHAAMEQVLRDSS